MSGLSEQLIVASRRKNTRELSIIASQNRSLRSTRPFPVNKRRTVAKDYQGLQGSLQPVRSWMAVPYTIFIT